MKLCAEQLEKRLLLTSDIGVTVEASAPNTVEVRVENLGATPVTARLVQSGEVEGDAPWRKSISFPGSDRLGN